MGFLAHRDRAPPNLGVAEQEDSFLTKKPYPPKRQISKLRPPTFLGAQEPRPRLCRIARKLPRIFLDQPKRSLFRKNQRFPHTNRRAARFPKLNSHPPSCPSPWT